MKQNPLENIDKFDQKIKDIIETIIKKFIWTGSPSTPEVVKVVRPMNYYLLKNREIFETAVHTPKCVKSVGYK